MRLRESKYWNLIQCFSFLDRFYCLKNLKVKQVFCCSRFFPSFCCLCWHLSLHIILFLHRHSKGSPIYQLFVFICGSIFFGQFSRRNVRNELVWLFWRFFVKFIAYTLALRFTFRFLSSACSEEFKYSLEFVFYFPLLQYYQSVFAKFSAVHFLYFKFFMTSIFNASVLKLP